MKLKMDFAINIEIDSPAQARAWQLYFAHLRQLVVNAIELQLKDNPPPQAEQYVVKVRKTDYLV